MSAVVELAYGLALLGDCREADRLVASQRQGLDEPGGDERRLALILIEGVIANSEGDAARAMNRFAVAAELGRLLPNSPWPCAANGWLSLLAYNRGDLVKSVHLLSRALRSSAPINDWALLRISTVAGLLCEYVGFSESAQDWLSASRFAIQRIRMPGLLSSVLFDNAVAAIDAAQHKRLCGTLDRHEAANLLLRVASAVNYDSRAGVEYQSSLHQLSMGMAQSLSRSYIEAKRSLEAFLSQSSGLPESDLACAHIELAYCDLWSRHEPLSEESAATVKRSLAVLRDPIEVATGCLVLVEHSRRSQDVRSEANWSQRLREELERRGLIATELRDVLQRCSVDQPSDSLKSPEYAHLFKGSRQ